MTSTLWRSTRSSTLPDVLYERMTFSGLDEAIERMRAFAKAHIDFEPSLVCERVQGGKRRWVLSVAKRTEWEATTQRRGHAEVG